jgi:hypothetical protein
MTEKRLLQIFLTNQSDNPGPGIFEVSSDSNKNLLCTCPGFASKNSCKHTALIESRIQRNNGVYQFDFSTKVSKEELATAMLTEKDFRELVLKHGKVEVY